MGEPTGEAGAFSFDPFTRHAFYRAVNRSLVERAVDRLPAGRHHVVVDLGCGTGAVTELVVAALTSRKLDATVVALEPSADALARAERRLDGVGLPVRLVQGDAADLPALGTAVDALFFCNAIHLVPDKAATIGAIAGSLAPGALLAINSTFFAGAYVPGTERFYRLWTVRAMRWLRAEHPDARARRGERAVAMQWLTDDEYAGLLHAAGLALDHCSREQAEMTLRSFQDIGRYALFVEGALPGVPIPLGAEALDRGAAEAFAELHLTSVPRNWLQIVARRHE